MTISLILVPNDERRSLETHRVNWDDYPADENDGRRHDDDDDPDRCMHEDITRILLLGGDDRRGDDHHLVTTPLLRPRGDLAGLYAYYHYFNAPEAKDGKQNVRATRLAMACGLPSLRFYGPVLLVRRSFVVGGRGRRLWENLEMSEIWGAACVSPDLRPTIQRAVVVVERSSRMTTMVPGGKDDDDSTMSAKVVAEAPEWLADAARQNYHDEAELRKIASAMNHGADHGDDLSGDVGDEESSDDDDDDNDDEAETITSPEVTPIVSHVMAEFVAKTPLCIHCRRASSELCECCEGVYFCSETNTGRTCKTDGWSHACLCPTWHHYSVSNRQRLSSFDDYFGGWQIALTSRPNQLDEEPYEDFLRSLGIDADSCASWWRTEIMGGWSGGKSPGASRIDASIRLSYSQGFAPIVDLPPERRITEDDQERSGLLNAKNGVGLLVLSSWREYYTLRNIPPTSPVCLLCCFPLTIYRAIERFGEVPVTVARMLVRPLRIHVVGAEKEMNFLDLFKEVSFLLPEDIELELVFVVREDMMPTKCQTTRRGDKFSMKIDFEAMVIGVVVGTYGGATLDPNFDIGTGPPDMVVALNAGLYAYESWRSVVDYLYYNKGVVGVFSDYNEYSGVNCAALGGGKSRESLCMNPFRQPRAMPVYSMNLPQFSNGFMYVFNKQELE